MELHAKSRTTSDPSVCLMKDLVLLASAQGFQENAARRIRKLGKYNLLKETEPA
jgi:hypothetical protein